MTKKPKKKLLGRLSLGRKKLRQEPTIEIDGKTVKVSDLKVLGPGDCPCEWEGAGMFANISIWNRDCPNHGENSKMWARVSARTGLTWDEAHEQGDLEFKAKNDG